MWLLATVIADLALCGLIGGFCLFVGVAISLTEPQSEAARQFGGFGAALCLIPLTAFRVVTQLSADGGDSE
jgi:hypothetical protein